MAQRYYGSIDLTTLIKQANAAHSAFSRAGKEKKAFANITIWVNDDPDKYGNSIGIQLNSKDKESAEIEGRIYIGNAKKSEAPEPEDFVPGEKDDVPDGDDDLPF